MTLYKCERHGHEGYFEDCPACRSYRNEPLEKVVSNPKEFWVYKMSCVDWDVSGAEPTNKKYTHVIEYSAYDELKAKAGKLAEAAQAIDKAFGDNFICGYCESKAGDGHVSQCELKQALKEYRDMENE